MSRRQDERGSAVVEFALVIPVFLTVVIGAATIVWLIGERSSITGAARDGARFASIALDPDDCTDPNDPPPCYPNEAAVQAYVQQRAGQPVAVDLRRPGTEIDPDVYRNQIVEVEVSAELKNVFSDLVGIGDHLDYTSIAKARNE